MKQIGLILIIVTISFKLNAQFSYDKIKGTKWILVDYLDSIMKTKAIYKYSFGNPSPSDLQICFPNNIKDSALFSGYHESTKIPFMNQKGNEIYYGFDNLQYFKLKISDSIMIFEELSDDPKFEIVFKGKFRYKLSKINYDLNPETTCTFLRDLLFNANFKLDNNLIKFQNGKVFGYNDFVRFEIGCNPYESNIQCDFIVFYDKKDKETRYGWRFINNKLNLYKLVKKYDKETDNEYFIMGELFKTMIKN